MTEPSRGEAQKLRNAESEHRMHVTALGRCSAPRMGALDRRDRIEILEFEVQYLREKLERLTLIVTKLADRQGMDT